MQITHSHEVKILRVRACQESFSPIKYLRFYTETLCMLNTGPSVLLLVPYAVNKKMILSEEPMKG